MKRPVTLTIAVVLQWIAAVVAILTALDLLGAASQLSSSDIPTQLEAAMVNQGIVDVSGQLVVTGVLTAGVLLLIVAFIRVLLSIYLWRGHNWARIVIAVLIVLNILAAASFLFEGEWLRGIATIVIDLVVLWLMYNPAANAFIKDASRPEL